MLDSSSVIKAGKKLFLLHEDNPDSVIPWDGYGFKLLCPKGAVTKVTEVAVTALVSGPFIIPKGTMLVSAVYAISVSKPLLKPLTVELQHCVNLKNTGQTERLKFVRASLKSEQAFHFNFVEGGSFNVGGRYGSIERDQFCGMGIVAMLNGNGNGNGGGGNGENSAQGISLVFSILVYVLCDIGEEGSTDTTNGDVPNGEASNGSTSDVTNTLSEGSNVNCYTVLCILSLHAQKLIVIKKIGAILLMVPEK